LVFDHRGDLIYTGRSPKQVDALVRYENTVYLQTAYSVIRLDVKSKSFSEWSCQTEQKKMLAVSANEILLCSPQKAVYMTFTQK
jgi:hypothetical protein